MNTNIAKIEEVRAALEARIGAEVKYQKVSKANMPPRDAFVVMGEGNIHPVIYFDPELPVAEFIAQAVEMYSSATSEKMAQYEVPEISREYILGNVHGYAVNIAQTGEYLNTLVHREAEDIALVYKVAVPLPVGAPGEASFAVTTSMAERYGITEEELYDASMEYVDWNVQVINLNSYLSTLPVGAAADLGDAPEMPLYIVAADLDGTGRGASVLFNRKVLDRVAGMLGEYYIIPSSTMEVLVLPASLGSDPDFLRDMIAQVNPTLDDSDRLSDNLYIYSYGEFSIVKKEAA